MAGTDFPLGSDVFLQLQAELRALVVHNQWTPYEALLTSIRNPAEFMGIDKDLGSLEPGKLADIIFVEGNPLENIDDTINVKATMVNGIYRTVEEIIAPFPTTGNRPAAEGDGSTSGSRPGARSPEQQAVLVAPARVGEGRSRRRCSRRRQQRPLRARCE